MQQRLVALQVWAEEYTCQGLPEFVKTFVLTHMQDGGGGGGDDDVSNGRAPLPSPYPSTLPPLLRPHRHDPDPSPSPSHDCRQLRVGGHEAVSHLQPYLFVTMLRMPSCCAGGGVAHALDEDYPNPNMAGGEVAPAPDEDAVATRAGPGQASAAGTPL